MKGLKKANQEILLTQIVPTLLQMLGLEALGAEEKRTEISLLEIG